MWSHYADSHKGIVIEYDVTDIEIKYLLKKVDYIYSLRLVNDDFIYYDQTSVENSISLLSLFNTKYNDWKYEKEYRIILYDENIDEDFITIELPIKAIYLGMNSSDEAEEAIKKLIKDKDIELFKMKTKDSNLFELEAESIPKV